MARLAKARQVLCITKRPRVPCFAQAHFHAAKDVAAGRTGLRVESLAGDGRLEAVAAMLGGKPTGASRKHAQELLESSLS